MLNKRLHRALNESGNLYSAQDLVRLIEEHKMQSFTDGETWVVTQINEFPQMRELSVVLGVGTMDGISHIENDLSRFARHVGARRIVMNGRKGWLGMQPMFDDWKLIGYRYAKEIGNGRS